MKTWEEIENAFEDLDRLSWSPNFCRLPEGYIIDENQSVKWNREQVRLTNENYRKELADLNAKKSEARSAILNDVYEYIQFEVGNNLSRESAIKIWEYAYAEGRDDGIHYIKCCLDDVIDLILEILDEQDRKWDLSDESDLQTA